MQKLNTTYTDFGNNEKRCIACCEPIDGCKRIWAAIRDLQDKVSMANYLETYNTFEKSFEKLRTIETEINELDERIHDLENLEAEK